MAESDQPKQPVKSPPVLPYRPGGKPDYAPLPPADLIYKPFGVVAFGLSITAAACVAGSVYWFGSRRSDGLRQGFCFGLLPWLLSVTLALSVAARRSAGRPWAILALIVDLVLLGLWIVGAR
jgi:hypothetical protein